jgi:hypothetical protein
MTSHHNHVPSVALHSTQYPCHHFNESGMYVPCVYCHHSYSRWQWYSVHSSVNDTIHGHCRSTCPACITQNLISQKLEIYTPVISSSSHWALPPPPPAAAAAAAAAAAVTPCFASSLRLSPVPGSPWCARGVVLPSTRPVQVVDIAGVSSLWSLADVD